MRLPARNALAIAAAIALFGIIAAFALLAGFHPPSPASEHIEQFRKEIRAQGGQAAYEALNARIASSSASQQHFSGHLFGKVLYEEAGTAGIIVCDERLGGGCAHEFAAEAIGADGVGAIASLEKECVEHLGSRMAIICEHGFGHGLLSYFGYTAAGLTDALAACDTFESWSPARGCYGGAFMEYNLRVMTELGPRPYAPDAPFELCAEVPGRYGAACAFWIAQWSLDAYAPRDKARDEAVFTAAGRECAQAPSAAFIEACFMGLGYFAHPAARGDDAKEHALCIAASAKPAHQAACIGYRRIDE